MSLQIGILYGKLELLIANSTWRVEFEELMRYRASVAAVSTDKGIFEKLPSDRVATKKMIIDVLGEKNFAEYSYYKEALKNEIGGDILPLSVKSLIDLHHTILPDSEITIRKDVRVLPKLIVSNNISKEVQLEVKTAPKEIKKKLDAFVEWFNRSYKTENPVILAALSHFYIAEIHPFSDGNGRLSNILGNIGFTAGGIFSKRIFAIERYLLQNVEVYYELLEEAIETGDQTKWISFYTEALLSSLIDAARLIKKITYGSVDVEQNQQIELSELEIKALRLLSEHPNVKIIEIARILGCSRQNVYRIINKLKDHDLSF